MSSREARLVFQAWDPVYRCTECDAEPRWWMYEYKGLRYCQTCTRKWWPHLADCFSTPGKKTPQNLRVRFVGTYNHLAIWYHHPID